MHDNFRRILLKVSTTIKKKLPEEYCSNWTSILQYSGIVWLEQNIEKRNWSFYLDLYNTEPNIVFSFVDSKDAVLFKLTN